MRKEKLKCGCVVEADAERYVSLCQSHEVEYMARHQAHLEDMAARRAAEGVDKTCVPNMEQ